MRGRATPAPVDDRHQRFGVEAIVDWSAVIDDTPISDVELARVEAAGARLLHTGNRWVRIDPAGLRRARTAAERAPARARVARRRRPPAAGERERGRPDGDMLADDGAVDEASTSASTEPTAGSTTSSPGSPTSVSRRCTRPARSRASCATISAAAWRGCSSSPGSASAAASPTTWGSARPPPRWPTSSSGPGRTSSCVR